MKMNSSRVLVGLMLLVSTLFAGCASGGGGKTPAELPTAFDQTDAQKRARIRLQLAVDYYEQRQLQVALGEIKQALLADPGLSDAHSLRALIYMDMGETQLAEENFQQAMRLAPNNPELNNNYGWFLCQNGRPTQALAYFDAAVKNRTYQSPEKALNNAGVCNLKAKDLPAAERSFSQAFQLDPGNPITNVNLAKIYYDRGDAERAKFYIGRVLRDDVMAADVLWLAVKIERKLGDKTAENSLATQLRRRHPNSPEFAAYQRGAFNE
jgi:type IV pilus assembly protein PilF